MPVKLKIISASKILFEDNVDYCEIPGEYGTEGILPGHINFLSFINAGVIKYKKGEKENTIGIEAGFAEINSDNVNVLIES